MIAEKTRRPETAARQVLPDHRQEALAALIEAGLAFTDLIPDGRFHRARKPNDAQWYIGNEGFTKGGKRWLQISAGDFRETGGEYVATVVWKSWARSELSRGELSEIRAEHKRNKEVAALHLSEDQEAARLKAMAVWAQASPGDHPYLTRKRLPPYNTKVWGDALLVPMYAIDGAFTSLQSILPDGTKRFFHGSRVAGTYHPFDFFFADERKVYVCEGWGTAAAIAKVRRVPVVAAFSAGNLSTVAKGIRREKPDLSIVIAADNDQWTAGNPGKTLAFKAAAAVGGKVIIPDFTDLDVSSRPSDWHDYLTLTGEL
jgi:putative DNA primase/helicase